MTRVLVDTSVWIDHLHRGDPSLVGLLDAGLVCMHPMIIGELALGALRDRARILSLLADMPKAPMATDTEVLTLIETRRLHGTGLSLVDAHLLAAVIIGADLRMWTRDRRLAAAAASAAVGWTGDRALTDDGENHRGRGERA